MQEISSYFSAILCDFSLNPGNDGALPKIPPLGIQNGAAADAEAVAAGSEEAPAAAVVPAGAGKTKIKDYLIEIVLFFMLILLHHTAS